MVSLSTSNLAAIWVSKCSAGTILLRIAHKKVSERLHIENCELTDLENHCSCLRNLYQVLKAKGTIYHSPNSCKRQIQKKT